MATKKKPIVTFPKNLLEPLRSYLLGEKKRLILTKKRLVKDDPFRNGTRENNDSAIDDEVDEQLDHDQVLAEKREASRLLINIKKTLARIKIGEYGICENCKRMIDTDRLAVNATAALCVECEKKKEKNKKK